MACIYFGHVFLVHEIFLLSKYEGVAIGRRLKDRKQKNNLARFVQNKKTDYESSLISTLCMFV